MRQNAASGHDGKPVLTAQIRVPCADPVDDDEPAPRPLGSRRGSTIITTTAPRSDTRPVTITEVLDSRAVTAVYQPIVDLTTGAVVGYEALARGPRGTSLESPAALFAAASAARRVAALDELCRAVAIEGARASVAPRTLFVNVEPNAAPLVESPPGTPADGPPAPDGLRVVAEITERDLTARPAQLLRMVEGFRARGWGIALDDVGADPGSLALLPLLRPDVIKLDLRLVQDQPGRAVAEIFSAVNAEAERSGAAVLAEGIETDEHAAVARSLGATLGQGWLLGRPGPLPDVMPPAPTLPLALRKAPTADPAASAFDLVAAHREMRSASKRLLVEVSKHLESQALGAPTEAVVLATFQHARHFTPATRARYARLAERVTFVGALGAEMAPAPAPGVRGGSLSPGDPVLREWDVAVLAPHFAAALVARDLGDDGPQGDRRFDYVLTHDRELVVAVAADLMGRMLPAGSAWPTCAVPHTEL